MSFKRLKESTGVVDNKSNSKDSEDSVIRDGILVHSGPEGEGLVYHSMDGPTKPFDAERIKRIVDNQNKLIDQLALEHGGFEKIPIGAFPPFKDAHDETGSSDKVMGRLAGRPRYEVRDVPKVGKNVSCVVASITFLGKENVAKVNDGRVYHLSVGIDEDADTLGETSSVVEPAAPGASLLGKGKQISEGVTKMSKKSLQASKQRYAKLSSMKEDLAKLSTKLVSSSESVKLAKAQDTVKGRLYKLMQAGKLTPAEYKKLSDGSHIKRMAAMPTEAIESLMASYEALEPKVIVGQRGSSDESRTVDFGSMGKELEKKQQKRLKADVKGELKKMGAKFKDDGEDDKDHGDKHEMADGASEEHRAGKKLADEASEEHRASAEHDEKLKSHLEHLKKCLEAGSIEEAKKAHEELSAHCAKHHLGGEKHMSGMDDVKSEDYKKAMEHLEGELDEVKTQMARFAGVVDELMAGEAEEEAEQPGIHGKEEVPQPGKA